MKNSSKVREIKEFILRLEDPFDAVFVANKFGIGTSNVNQYIKTMISHGQVKRHGVRKANYDGYGERTINVFKVIDDVKYRPRSYVKNNTLVDERNDPHFKLISSLKPTMDFVDSSYRGSQSKRG